MRAALVLSISVVSAAAGAQTVLDSFNIGQQLPVNYPKNSTVAHPLLGLRTLAASYDNGFVDGVTPTSSLAVMDTPSGSSGVLSFQYNTLDGASGYASYWNTTGATINLSSDSQFAFTLGKVQGTNYVGVLLGDSNGTTVFDSLTVDISNSYSSFDLAFSNFTSHSIVPFQWNHIREIDLEVGNLGGQSVTEFNYFGAAAAAATPEPSTWAVLGLGVFAMLRRRKRSN